MLHGTQELLKKREPAIFTYIFLELIVHGLSEGLLGTLEPTHKLLRYMHRLKHGKLATEVAFIAPEN